VRRKPYSVVLFDEIEKAHREVFNTLLQVLDDGRLTDGQGRTVNFRNTVIIMTSNIGSQYINDPALSAEQRTEAALAALRQNFPPEFLNRIDDIIVFHALTRSDLVQIVDIQLLRLHRLLDAQGLKLMVSDRAKVFLAERGYDPTYGARPIKRAIQQYVQDPLSRELLEGHFRRGDKVVVDLAGQGDRLAFSKEVVGEPVAT